MDFKDRVPQYPGRIKLTPVSGQTNVYDMVIQDGAGVTGYPIGTPLNKATFDQFNAGLIEADLISSEVAHRRFHLSLLGFHPAKQDFIKFIRLAGIIFVLASLFCF